MTASVAHEVPIEKKVLAATFNNRAIGVAFKKEQAVVKAYLKTLGEEDLEACQKLIDAMAANGSAEVGPLDNGKTYTITPDLMSYKPAVLKIHEEKFIPSVVEPSFGVGRLIYSILEHSFYVREGEEKRTVMAFKPAVAAIKCSIMPINNSEQFNPTVEKIGEALNDKVLNNVWIPDGLKDVPADRMGPRMRLKASLDEIFAEKLPHVIDCVESKVFAVGVESYTVGSNEFYMSYAGTHPGVYNLLDNGHYHPTEVVSDKIPALLCYFDYIPLHVTRGVRWDSDHVVALDDELKEIMKEIVRNDAMDKVLIGLDFFDASINRVAAWVIGCRNAQKALLWALLQPNAKLRELQDEANFTEKFMLMEEAKTLPFSDIWAEYCTRQGVPADASWFDQIKAYEARILPERA